MSDHADRFKEQLEVSDRRRATRQAYVDKAHAMQTGVAIEMQHDDGPTSAKHLRVGINAAMSDQAGLVKLLIAKGTSSPRPSISTRSLSR